MTKTSMDLVLEELLDQRAWVEGLCNALVRDRSQAQDLAQETMTSALQAKGPIANVRAYLRRVAENHALQKLRKDLRRQRRERVVAEATGSAPSASEVGEAFETQRQVAQAVHGLAEPFRTTVLLHHYEGLSLAEIARRQQTAEGTVRWRLFRAHALLRQQLEGTYGRDWRLALLPLCTPGLSRSASALVVAAGALLLAGGVYLAWPDDGRSTAEASAAAPSATAAGGEPSAAADPREPVRTAVERSARTDGPGAAAPAALPAAEQRAVVRARIVDDAGQPIAGAALRLDRLVHNGMELQTPLQALLLPEAPAGDDGRAALPLRTDQRLFEGMPESMRPSRGEPWQLAFAVRAEGYLPAQRTAFVADGDDTDLGDVPLVRGAVLRGRVVTKDGSTIGGARVGVFGPPLPTQLLSTPATKSDLDAAVATAETPSLFSRGRYELTPAPRGPVLLVAMAEGYRSASLCVDVLAEQQDLPDLVLEPAPNAPRGKHLVVRVVDEQNAPVSGALVYRRQEHGASSGSTGPDGQVRFAPSLRDGEPDLSPTTIVALDPTGRLQAAREADVVPAGDVVTMTLRSGRAVEVIVRSPAVATGDIRVDWAAAPPVVAALWLQTSGDRARFVPPPFAARLRVARDRCVPWVSEPIEPDAWPERIEVRLEEQAALLGSVAADGQPVAGAQVLALTRGKQVLRDGYRMGEWAATGRFHAQTDARGEFALSREAKGELRLLVTKDGLAPAVTGAFVFDPAHPVRVPPITLTRGGAVRGVLRTADARPLARKVVALHHPVFGPRTQLTQRDGTFTFDGVAPGDYEVRPGERPVAGGWTESPLGESAQLPFAVDAVVREGETAQVDVIVDACRLAVQITASSALRLAGWTVALRAAVDSRDVEPARSLPADGKVEFATARAGEYDVVLRAPGGPFGDVEVRARATLLVGDNQLAVPLALAPWRGAHQGLLDAKTAKLVHVAAGLRVEAWATVDVAKGELTCPLAPVGAVDVMRGQQVVMRIDTGTSR